MVILSSFVTGLDAGTYVILREVFTQKYATATSMNPTFEFEVQQSVLRHLVYVPNTHGFLKC